MGHLIVFATRTAASTDSLWDLFYPLDRFVLSILALYFSPLAMRIHVDYLWSDGPHIKSLVIETYLLRRGLSWRKDCLLVLELLRYVLNESLMNYVLLFWRRVGTWMSMIHNGHVRGLITFVFGRNIDEMSSFPSQFNQLRRMALFTVLMRFWKLLSRWSVLFGSEYAISEQPLRRHKSYLCFEMACWRFRSIGTIIAS